MSDQNKGFKAQAHVHSLDCALAEVTILEEDGPNHVIAEYDGKICTAIFNVFVGRYYVDDTYGIIEDYRPRTPEIPETDHER